MLQRRSSLTIDFIRSALATAELLWINGITSTSSVNFQFFLQLIIAALRQLSIVSGTIYAVPPDRVPDEAILAAIFHY